MRLISAKLTNYCQYRELSVNFSAGLTAILGRNGSGKSNLVNAIYACITGDFGRNSGVKTDNICQTAPSNAPSKIEVVLEHAGNIIQITRGLRPVAARLVITPADGEVITLTKVSEIDAMLSNILGVSDKLLDDYIFVNQWAIFDFLSMIPTDRAKAFQRLFRTEKALQLWKVVHDFAGSITIPTPGICRDTLLKRLSENRVSAKSLDAEYQKYKQEQSSYSYDDDRLTITAWSKKSVLEKEIKALNEKCQRLLDSGDALTEKIKDAKSKFDAIDGLVEHGDSGVDDARKMLAEWQIYEHTMKSRDIITTQMELIGKELDTLQIPNKPENYVSTFDDAWWNDYRDKVKRFNAAQHFMKMLTADDQFCPTCGTPRMTLVQHRNEYEETASKLAYEVAICEKIIKVSEAYDTALRAYNAKKSSLLKQADNYTNQLAQTPAVTAPSKDKETLQQMINNHDNLHREYNHCKSILDTLSTQQKEKLATLTAVKDVALAPKEREYAELKVSEDEYLAAKARIDAYSQRIQHEAKIAALLNVVQRSIKDDEAALEDLKRVEYLADIERDWLRYSDDMQEVFHRNGLPKLVAQNYLELMHDEINRLLIKFDSPFSITTDDELSFIANFKEGKRIPAARLSGGEKVLLALAFRVAVNDVFARDLGLLILDEPTAGLDDNNLSCLKTAISRLKELAASRGLQMIMITHEKDLSYLFDHTIELGKDNA